MSAYRLNRLLNAASGRCLAVAVDHGVPGEPDLMTGIDDMETVVDTLVAAEPDALLLGPGQADLLQRRAGRAKPALILRVDVPNIYGQEIPDVPTSVLLDDPVGMAVRLDAACVIVNLIDTPGQASLRSACVDNIGRLRTACDRAGMPLMVEPLPMLPQSSGYDVHRDADRLRGLVRQATELGADVIKADPLPDAGDFRRVVQVARVPLFVRGGGRIDDRELLEITESVLGAGAAGLVYGRNVIQHADPSAMTRALASLVHEGAGADRALELVSA